LNVKMNRTRDYPFKISQYQTKTNPYIKIILENNKHFRSIN